MARTRFGYTSAIAWTPGLFAIAGFVIAATAAIAQAVFGNGILSSEVVGGTGGLVVDEGRAKFSSPLVAPQRNLDTTGLPCLNVYPFSEQQTINTMIYNHVLVLDNHCSKEIKIRACYYKTDSCQEISVSSNKRQRYIFGVFTTPDFRFAYREYVN